MTTETRKQQILELIERKGYISIKEICSVFYISEPTARRDLAALEREGVIHRSHGGAAPSSGGVSKTVEMRNTTMREQKRKIARAAAELVSDGDIVFIDTSTTAQCIIPFLAAKNGVTVITNSVPALSILKSYGIAAKCTGGDLNPNSMGLVGYTAERFAASVRVDLMFFSTPCINVGGVISDYSEKETHLRQVVLENCRKSLFMFDSSKFDKQAAYRVTDLSNVSCVISDMELDGIFDCDAGLITV